MEVALPIERGLQLTGGRSAEKRPLLTEFIPYRTQIVNTTMRYALAGDGPPIQDKNARLLYLAIDDKKNIGELAYTTQLNIQEFYAALCLLLAQKHIQLFEARGYPEQKLIDAFTTDRATN